MRLFETILDQRTCVFMRVAMIGSGYVGLVSGACFADFGHQVTCVDKDAAKIARLRDGDIPIFEPDLDRLVAANMREKRLDFTTDLAGPVAEKLKSSSALVRAMAVWALGRLVSFDSLADLAQGYLPGEADDMVKSEWAAATGVAPVRAMAASAVDLKEGLPS